MRRSLCLAMGLLLAVGGCAGQLSWEPPLGASPPTRVFDRETGRISDEPALGQQAADEQTSSRRQSGTPSGTTEEQPLYQQFPSRVARPAPRRAVSQQAPPEPDTNVGLSPHAVDMMNRSHAAAVVRQRENQFAKQQQQQQQQQQPMSATAGRVFDERALPQPSAGQVVSEAPANVPRYRDAQLVTHVAYPGTSQYGVHPNPHQQQTSHQSPSDVRHSPSDAQRSLSPQLSVSDEPPRFNNVAMEDHRTWQEKLEGTIATLKSDLAHIDFSEREVARHEVSLRLLAVVANMREQAVTPIRQLEDDEREFWKHQLYGLLVALDADDDHAASRRAALALRDFRQAAGHLASISTLDVRNLAFCSDVQGYGNTTPFKSDSFSPGKEVLLYVEVDNFAAHQQNDAFATELQAEYEIIDDRGERVANITLPSDSQTCDNRRRDYFIAYPLTLPEEIGSGNYTLRLTIEDKIGKKSNHAEIGFRIR